MKVIYSLVLSVFAISVLNSCASKPFDPMEHALKYADKSGTSTKALFDRLTGLVDLAKQIHRKKTSKYGSKVVAPEIMAKFVELRKKLHDDFVRKFEEKSKKDSAVAPFYAAAIIKLRYGNLKFSFTSSYNGEHGNLPQYFTKKILKDFVFYRFYTEKGESYVYWNDLVETVGFFGDEVSDLDEIFKKEGSKGLYNVKVGPLVPGKKGKKITRYERTDDTPDIHTWSDNHLILRKKNPGCRWVTTVTATRTTTIGKYSAGSLSSSTSYSKPKKEKVCKYNVKQIDAEIARRRKGGKQFKFTTTEEWDNLQYSLDVSNENGEKYSMVKELRIYSDMNPAQMMAQNLERRASSVGSTLQHWMTDELQKKHGRIWKGLFKDVSDEKAALTIMKGQLRLSTWAYGLKTIKNLPEGNPLVEPMQGVVSAQ